MNKVIGSLNKKTLGGHEKESIGRALEQCTKDDTQPQPTMSVSSFGTENMKNTHLHLLGKSGDRLQGRHYRRCDRQDDVGVAHEAPGGSTTT